MVPVQVNPEDKSECANLDDDEEDFDLLFVKSEDEYAVKKFVKN